MYAKLKSFGLTGMDAFDVEVEIDLSRGLPAFDLVGLPDLGVKESKDRVRSSLKNCGFEFPVSKITVNLAPANVKKFGPIYDLPIFLGILSANKDIPYPLEEFAFFGELSLKGDVRGVAGALPMALQALKSGVKALFVPEENALEASAVKGLTVYPVAHVTDILKHFSGEAPLSPMAPVPFETPTLADFMDFSEVKGQDGAKFAMEIAAAGGHHLLMIGPPGSGKSMLAKRFPSILPAMTFEEALETSMIHSISGNIPKGQAMLTQRPYRAPHHTISAVGLSGGGSSPKPGEISLANHGILFLDELAEFNRTTMEILRQPLEDGHITITRANSTATYPCNMTLIAAMNPCPCGYYGHPTTECSCTNYKIAQYMGKISGPLLDRLDLHVEVGVVEFSDLSGNQKAESSAQVKQRVEKARNRQLARYEKYRHKTNARITPAMSKEFCTLTEEATQILKMSFERLGLSARAYDRILKIALTIADLDGSDTISSGHIATAIQYRSLDRKFFHG